MENPPKELSLQEIRKFMIYNNYKVTNHALVKHFRGFLTNKDTQDEARKCFKTYVNILASIKQEGSEKYLVLRKKYYDEIPSTDESLDMTCNSLTMSPASRSYAPLSDADGSPMRQPPPYRPPPVVSQNSPRRNSSEYVRSGSEISFGSEFSSVDLKKMHPSLMRNDSIEAQVLSRKHSVELAREEGEAPPAIPPRKKISESGRNSVDENAAVGLPESNENKENMGASGGEKAEGATDENKLSVKEKMMKFNRFASEEEAKIPSPIGKKKPDKNLDETVISENLLQHPKAKEWLIAAAKSDFQLLAKLSIEHPNLVKLQDISTGYTALHWAAKHGSEDIVKLVAGKLKADVNARTNGGYTALHIATQFGRNDIFELLCNVYKADRDMLDWSGKKALEYQKQLTSVSASTYSSEYEPKLSKHEKFFTLPSKTLSPLTRGGTFMRRKRRQRPSTTDHATLQTFVESFTSATARGGDTNNNNSRSSSSSIIPSTAAKAKTKHPSNPTDLPNATDFPAGTAGPQGTLSGRRNRSNQSFFRKKRNPTNIV
uniref:Putative ankyrin n=1 Tax=Anopheles triannulatus TaxID=58253 RepID=A0A2M4ACF1_9DIPT